MESYTKGEWRVHQVQDSPTALVMWGNTPICIAEVSSGASGFPAVATANARLIAAAPDLLEALQAILNGPAAHWKGPNGDRVVGSELFDAAKTVVAKALGQIKRVGQ